MQPRRFAAEGFRVRSHRRARTGHPHYAGDRGTGDDAPAAPSSMKLYFVAGEASGDARGAEVMASLAELGGDVQFFGAGGPAMRALAGEHFDDWSEHAVIGIIDVVKNYGYFKAQFEAMLAEIARVKPDAVILIDYPGFNLRMAKAIRTRKLPTRVIYYVSPQVWAWNRGRI